jgi:hypothetical protein
VSAPVDFVATVPEVAFRRNQKMISKPVLPALKFPSPGVHPSDFVWQFYCSSLHLLMSTGESLRHVGLHRERDGRSSSLSERRVWYVPLIIMDWKFYIHPPF